jgi:hypothetical protein
MTAVVAFTALFLLLGGCKKGPTEDEMTTAVCDCVGFPETVTFTLQTGTLDQVELGAFGTWDDYVKAWSDLDSLGYVDLVKLGKKSSGSWLNLPRDQVKITLTEKGRDLFRPADEGIWEADLCRRVLSRIVSVETRGDGEIAEVEYAWTCSDFSPIFEAVRPVSRMKDGNPKAQIRETVTMRKVEGCWTIEE